MKDTYNFSITEKGHRFCFRSVYKHKGFDLDEAYVVLPNGDSRNLTDTEIIALSAKYFSELDQAAYEDYCNQDEVDGLGEWKGKLENNSCD